MLSKKEIKDIQSLSQKKFRDELNVFIAEGPKIVTELIELIPQQVEKVYALKAWIDSNSPSLQKINVAEISGAELDRVSQLHTPNQVMAVIKKLPVRRPGTGAFILYLDTIQDPGNFGTIIRIADWFGIKDVVCSTGCADLYNPKSVQATMASIGRVNVFYDEKDGWLNDQTVPVFAASLHGMPLTDLPKTPEGILIIGNESKGIRKEFLRLATKQVTIPKKGNAESLNAAVATGIILSHLVQ